MEILILLLVLGVLAVSYLIVTDNKTKFNRVSIKYNLAILPKGSIVTVELDDYVDIWMYSKNYKQGDDIPQSLVLKNKNGNIIIKPDYNTCK